MKLFFEKKGTGMRVVAVVTIIVIFLTAAHFLFRSANQAAQKKAFTELRAVSSVKTLQLAQWLKERNSEVLFFSDTEPYKTAYFDMIKGASGKEVMLREALHKIMSKDRYEEIFLLDDSAHLLFSANPEFLAIDTVTARYALQVFRTQQITISDLYYCLFHHTPHFEILAPVFDPNKQVIATLVFRINPFDYLYPLIENWPGQSESGENLVVKQSGDSVIYMNHLRHLPEKMPPIALPLAQKHLPSVQAVLGKAGSIESVDYSGRAVLADVSRIPETSWFLVVKKDAKEVYASVRHQALLLLIISILSLFFLGLFVAWLLSNRERNLYKELLINKSELFQAQEAFRATLYSMGDGVITTNLEGRIEQVNPIAESLTGWSEPEAKGRALEEVFSIIKETTREKVDSPATRVLAEGKIVGFANHTLLVSRNGREIPIDDSGAPIRDQEGKTQGVVLIFRDRSEERARQKVLEIRIQLFEGATTHTLKELFCKALQDIAALSHSPIACFQLNSLSGEPLERFHSDGCKSEVPKTDCEWLFQELFSREPFAEAIKCGKPIIENNYPNPSRSQETPQITRILAIPVIRKQITVGLLLLCNKSDNYTPFETSLVSFLSDTLFETAERMYQEEALRDSETKHRKLIEQMQLGLALHEMIFDEDGKAADYRFLDVNHSFEKITSLRREDIVGKTVLEVLPQTEKSWIERYGSVVQTGNPVSFEDYAASLNRYYNVIAYKYRPKEFAVIVEDITQRKQMESTLRESEEQYRLIMDNSLDAIMLARPTGSILAANKAACQMFRMSEEEICSADMRDIVDMEDPRLHKMMQTYKNAGQMQTELNFVRKGGEFFPGEISASLFLNSKRELFATMTIRDLTQEKAAIEALRTSEQQYKELIDGMNETVWVIGFDGNLIEVNKMAVSTLGYTQEELLSIGLSGVDHSLKKEDILWLAKTMETDQLQIFETTHMTKSGRVFPVEVYSSLINYKGHQAILSIARDITIRKQMEHELREQGETIRLLFDSTAEGIMGIDVDGNCTFCNNAALSLLAHTDRSDIIGNNLHALMHHTHIDGSNAPQESCAVRNAFLSGKGIHLTEEWLWKKSGEPFPVELWSHPIFRDNQVIGSVVTFIDVTQRKHDENAKQILYKIARTSSDTKDLEDLLVVVREELSRVLDTTNFYVAVLTPDKQQLRRVFFTNEKIDLEQWDVNTSLSGQIILQKCSILLRGEEERIRFEQMYGVTLPVTPASCWLGVPILVEGQPFGALVVQSYTNPNAYNEQHLLLLETIAHELAIVFHRTAIIQDLIKAKEKAEESDHLKSAFLANMSHEIRTPMNAILGFLSLLEEPDLDEANRKEYIEIVNKSGKRLLDTINDIIEISKIESRQLDLHLEAVKLHDVMQYFQDLFKLQTSEKGLDYTIHPIQAPETVYTDKTKLEGILINLIKNAIKFTAKGSIDVGCSLEGEWLNFYVKDTGRGISEEKLQAIFERFVQADTQISRPYEGSGLGLAIVKGYINSLGGTIRVESKVGHGSAFYFSIPYLAE